MTRYNNMKDCHVAISTGNDAGGGRGLTAWRNADAVFEAAELIPTDLMLGWYCKEPTYKTEQTGAMSTTRVKHRYTTGREEGIWKSKHAFQTCQFIYWIMQTVGAAITTENTPVGYNTHALTIGATNVPDWHGIHFEREGITSNELRYDIMGVLPSDLVINCGQSKENYKATQEITIPFSFLNAAATDLTAQTKRKPGTLGQSWKDWSNVITGNGGGKDPSGLKYNGANLEVDILNLSLKFHRDYYFGTPDTTGYPTNGLMLGWDYSVVLDVKPIGDLFYTVNRAALPYAGDLDYDFYFETSANDKIRCVYDKMYMVPVDEENDWDSKIEGYTITLEPLDTTSSLTVTGIDILNNDHFENP